MSFKSISGQEKPGVKPVCFPLNSGAAFSFDADLFLAGIGVKKKVSQLVRDGEPVSPFGREGDNQMVNCL